MQIYLYKLKFQGPTHFGDTGIDLENVSERVSSDTLFSAFVNSIRTTEGLDTVNDFINTFIENPPFFISSLFLYHGDKFFLPRPLSDKDISKEVRKELGKDLKKLSWLTPQSFLKWITGSDFNVSEIKSMREEQDNNYDRSFKVEIRPRVSLDRTTRNSNIYHCSYIYFEENAGLYGMVAFSDIHSIDLFKQTLQVLGEIGLGGEKAYGAGMFKLAEFRPIESPFSEIFSVPSSSQHVLLSLYHPSTQELSMIQTNLLAYGLLRKKGWVASGRYALPIKRKSVGFFAEGSVFSSHLRGRLVDVTPDGDYRNLLEHKVYRYGYAFMAPMIGGQ